MLYELTWHEISVYSICIVPCFMVSIHQPSASVDNANLVLDNSRYHAKTEFNNCLLLNCYR